MRVGFLRSCGAMLVAACLAASGLVSVASAADLKMTIQNNSSEELYYNSNSNVKSYPNTIAAGTKSSEIEADGKNKGSVGQITYLNNQQQAEATCAVTLEFSYIVNTLSGNCDDKNFTIVNKGQCSLVKAGTCGGSSNCDCHFDFNTTN